MPQHTPSEKRKNRRKLKLSAVVIQSRTTKDLLTRLKAEQKKRKKK